MIAVSRVALAALLASALAAPAAYAGRTMAGCAKKSPRATWRPGV
jgi:hypothetical protein